ncbi:hypothetical protein [Shewanella aestuarii]|uniref:Uncharacterized protein n=1 Tax=Shewanella aestuarii TaxID=1028752 RepID=A0A6G9QSA1_9GAMM|nr:hypothetical protein [Shewanella aestuarii]QIR16659.1 hypothetical protein HBH39_19490 [Shewanella aestuarii]
MRILKNPFKALSEEEIAFVRQFITENRDPDCAKIIHSAFLTGKDIDLNEVRYPLSRYITTAFDVFVNKRNAITHLRRFKSLDLLTDKGIDLICLLHKRPPKPEYRMLFTLVFKQQLSYTAAMQQINEMDELENKIVYPNIVRSCKAFEKIVSILKEHAKK